MIHEELDEYLCLVSHDNAYRVVEPLKRSAYEVTETVLFCGENGVTRGPFVRKRIARGAGVGGAYQEMLRAQQQGQRFVHVPRIEDCYELGDDLVVVMEHVEGKTLHDLVYDQDPSWELAAWVFPMLCDAVAELHEGFDPPIIHRDLKPSNVIVSPANLTLIDFGIARTYRDGAEADTNAFGTRAYAPPEQFGFGQTGPRSDVYALGMLLYYVLTEEVPSPTLAGGAFDREGVPEPLRPVLSKATAFDPAARYDSARELKQAFEAAVASLAAPVPAELPEPQGEPTWPPRAFAAGSEVAAAPIAMAASFAWGEGATGAALPSASGQQASATWRAALDPLRRASEWAGLAWDALLVLFAVGTVAVCCGDVAEPNAEAGRLPLWLRAWQYCGVALLMVGFMGLLVDWRWLRTRVRPLGGFRWGRWLVGAAIVVAAGFSIALSGSVVAAALFPQP